MSSYAMPIAVMSGSTLAGRIVCFGERRFLWDSRLAEYHKNMAAV